MNSLDQKQELERRLVEKAMKDDMFREQLISDPRRAIETELGILLPANMQVKVLEEDATNVYLVLPANSPAGDTDELSEMELEAVSGGLQDNYSGYIHCSAGTLCACTG